MQRHHLLPRQLVRSACFGPLLAALGKEAIGFDDFRANGLLLPGTESAALASGAPLHRGPHRLYNEMVAQRVGRIEACWSRRCARHPETARIEALMRMRLLQRALRARLLQRNRRALFLNRKDPFRAGLDFTMLDSMVESLWLATAAA
ncbi:hypothetical protein AAW00_04275 [Aurantiacibacter luteus]|uniref:Uncharacterized protein n=2 Tax=Aurantiacibacter luteus TaxID=1581420 RepID=A0A0G9MZ97_9SPHN|nr:hypothetical protein AAW00_04275 [Aurantiacibacter luteus]